MLVNISVRRNVEFSSKSALTALLAAAMISLLPVSAADYTLGVEAGDWVRYEATSSWDGTGTEPEWARYDWLRMEVQSVTGTDVAVLFSTHYKDGTEENSTLSWSVRTGGEMWIISADLEKGDPIAVGANWIINDTITRTYAGASRSVNFLNISQAVEDAKSTTVFYWDQTTGVLLEVSSNKTSPTENWTLRYRAVETSLWGPSPLQVTAESSPDTVTQGDAVTVSAAVKDEAGNPIEGATVAATIGDLEILFGLSDQGNGDYQGTIDTSIIGKGTHEIVVTAQKGGYLSAQTSLTLTVETLRLQMSMQLSAETVKRGDSLSVSAEIGDLAGTPVEGVTVTVYIDDKAVDLQDFGDGYYQVDVDTSDIIEGTYNIMVSAHKEGCESTDISGMLTVETRRLQVTIQLSTDTATQGDTITVSATVQDLEENPVEGATVMAALGHKTVPLSDQGDGHYQGDIDTFDISEGSHLVTVTAEKELCESAENAETLHVEAAVPWMLYIGIAAVLVIAVAILLIIRMRR